MKNVNERRDCELEENKKFMGRFRGRRERRNICNYTVIKDKIK